MAGRVDSLAQQLEDATREFATAIERYSDAQWQATCADDQRPVGVIAHHVATSYVPLAGMAVATATNQPLPPLTPDSLNEANRQHAETFAGATKAETLAQLRAGSVQAVEMIRGLGDDQLDRTAQLFGNTITAQQMIEGILISHPRSHLASIRAAAGS